MKSAVVALFAVAILLSVQAEPCGKGVPCPEGECCMIVYNSKYGLPSCRPLRTSGEDCRPNSQPQNMSLSAGPQQADTLYTDVYLDVCPCQSGLQCAHGTCA